jgi:hypothetical protein
LADCRITVLSHFRTYEEYGLLFYHSFSSEGFIKVFLEDARLKVLLVKIE